MRKDNANCTVDVDVEKKVYDCLLVILLILVLLILVHS